MFLMVKNEIELFRYDDIPDKVDKKQILERKETTSLQTSKDLESPDKLNKSLQKVRHSKD